VALMKPDRRRIAPIGLYLAGLAVLAALFIFVVQREWNLAVQVCLGLALVGLASYALLDPAHVRRVFTGRQARYGSNALVLTAAFIGIIVVANYLVYQLAGQHPLRWDISQDKKYTLAEESLKTLEGLNGEVTAQAFFTTDIPRTETETLLEQYRSNSAGKFSYQFIDPVSNPVAAEQAGIANNGSIVLQMDDRRQIIYPPTEPGITSGLVRLLNPQEQKVYFLTGHGEHDLEATGDSSYALVKRMLESKNYIVEQLSLLNAQAVPVDARLVVIAGPKQPLAENEAALLIDYLENGGGLVLMQDPQPQTQSRDQSDVLVEYLQDTWGIELGNDIVVDPNSGQSPTFAIGVEYGSSPITESLRGYYTVLPITRSVSVGGAPSAYSKAVLVLTAEQAWAETDLVGIQEDPPQVEYDPDQDVGGPVPLAASGENFQTDARVVVIGDSDFVANANFTVYANSDFFANVVDWTARQEQIISLTPRSQTQRLILPPQKTALNLVFLGTVIILPGIVLAAGIAVFLQRRKKG
jgi:ABC-type uncharacterized transport system involved in gliding motility auxiliary subunit